MHDLVVRLLAKTVQVSHAITRLQELAAANAAEHPQALADVADAVTMMVGVRAALMNGADTLTDDIRARQC